jgi:hypothetical protein
MPAKATSSNVVRAKIERYKSDYEVIYGTIQMALADPDNYDFNETFALVRSIMEMHPYQTYAWKSGKPASNKSTGGKKEAMHLRNFRGGNKASLAGLIDISRAKFSDMKGFITFVRLRLSLVADATDIDAVLQS